jgi:hypothetical protein
VLGIVASRNGRSRNGCVRNGRSRIGRSRIGTSTDRNRPPQSQVACKLTPLVPHLAPVPSLPKFQPLLGFPRSNMHLIRATLRTRPTRSRTLPVHIFPVNGMPLCRWGGGGQESVKYLFSPAGQFSKI